MQLADLDRDELLALAEQFCPADGPALLRARVEAARKREAASFSAWKKASDTAIADARAARARIEAGRFDEATTNLMRISKESTRQAAKLWTAYGKAFQRRVAVAREAARVRA
ncbi:hypothetical protein CCR94_16425 [Rhodoblastus sphagnicola]|uniref:Uncharacterized protein n=1 Tax=Rhodoblastus sphagnicola TaxID=333368 RepID=A0A2S6N304_9HYPH|nr:hypothetical protein [Rhodoblastus sphagnicola]MBB4199083.1 hypothetical protein [Rhodoblastus sphagnicola]PPQ28976.1 hypothetical protein CCR94_16425 [Rhodoblastus sphagnicola]